jgi:hypothetical protein
MTPKLTTWEDKESLQQQFHHAPTWGQAAAQAWEDVSDPKYGAAPSRIRNKLYPTIFIAVVHSCLPRSASSTPCLISPASNPLSFCDPNNTIVPK